MASKNDFIELLRNPDFKMLVAQILAILDKSRKAGVTTNVACDALLFVDALLYDANPFNEGPKGLKDAHNQISADAKSMLNYIRDASLLQGKPLLATMIEHPTIDKQRQV